MNKTTFRRTLLALHAAGALAAAVFASNSSHAAESAAGANLLIENVTIVSPELAAPQPGRWVRIENGRISAIADHAITAPAGTRRLNGAGKFLTPGLMDSHVHVSIPAGLPFGVQSPGLDRLVSDYQRQQPRSYLYFGVTQLLDPAGFEDGIAAFKAQPQKPDLFRCGAASVLNGYPRIVAGNEVHSILPEFIYEPENPDPIPAGVDPAQHTPEAVVARIAASGARCIKIFIEDGFGEAHHMPLLKPKTMARVRAAAHQAGLLVVAHANAYDMQQIAVTADVDVLAHGLWSWGKLSSADGLPSEIAALMQQVQQKHIGFQPTLRVVAGLRDLFVPATLSDPVLSKITPPAVLDFYRSADGKFFQQELRADFGDGSDAELAAVYEKIYQQGARVTRYLHSIGQPLLLASDTPSAPVYANQPGYNSYQELRALINAGIPLDAAFRAGTLNNARQFGLDGDYGTVEQGKIANLLLLASNPLQTADAWAQIETVILHGNPLARESLAAN
ncbi:amidohydrolase family protein [Permianibacter sp. IMCC34836]|uniref:amidohydrolase family protein n=1 Tax=Permianibacter fluminis TaxID=2738515 RepID=UPI001552DB4B|nr:amidohydrolase family protein [Permianibacter fluminis]NQD35890.1 amidohydrolase family protein [Permianibacter fluminis]